MSEPHEEFNSIQDAPFQLSAKELQANRFQPRSNNKNNNNQTKTLSRLQNSKPPRNSVKLKPTPIDIHFKWALILTILCFFLIAPCWALYKTFELRRKIERQEVDAATRLSNKIQSILIVSSIIGAFAWVAILFCSVGLLITGQLLVDKAI